MIIQPKVRGFICTTAHPTGCHQTVLQQVNYVKKQAKLKGPMNVLIIGASTGYGLASRIVATFGADAKTIGVFFEKEADEKRTASAGWYNTAAFEKIAHKEGHYAKSINGDAFSNEIKEQTVKLIRKDLGKIDLIIYSLASPRRVHPNTGHVYSSVLKPIGQSYTSKTVDTFKEEVKEITLEAATPSEIENTIAVMGGEDWEMWVSLLLKENLLAEGVKTVAYSYVGPTLTHPIYKNGTIGKAKEDLLKVSKKITAQLSDLHGEALISVNKGLVTQASAAIPVVPLYISLIYKLMKAKGTHEGCIEQMERLFRDNLYSKSNRMNLDDEGQIRLDDFEMEPELQRQIAATWPRLTTENLKENTDIEGYREEFYRLFGFHYDNVNYETDVDPNVGIESIETISS